MLYSKILKNIKNLVNKDIHVVVLVFSLFFLAVIFSIFQSSFYDLRSSVKNILTYAYHTPYTLGEEGSNGGDDVYTLGGGYYSAPTTGNSGDSQNFSGYTVYEYFYPANPEKNNNNRKALYSYNANGSLEVSGNLVINGETTQLQNSYSNGHASIASNNNGENYRHFVTTEAYSDDVSMNGNAYVNYQWDEDKEGTGYGPSVYLNARSSELEMEENYYLSSAKKDAIIETSLLPGRDAYVWKEYLNQNDAKISQPTLSGPTAFFYKDGVFLIADAGNSRIVAYNPVEGSLGSLGRGDWTWKLNGITADDEGMIFVTDDAKDLVIKTKISGDEWEESYKNIDNYQSRLYLNGSENFKVKNRYAASECRYNYDTGVEECTPYPYKPDYTLQNTVDCGDDCDLSRAVTLDDSADGFTEPVSNTYENSSIQAYTDSGNIAAYAELLDCGYNGHQVTITSARKFIALDEHNKPMMLSYAQDQCAFGGDCFTFDGSEYIDLPDAAAWNFGNDYFTIDMWIKFDSITHTMAIVSHPGSFLLELEMNRADSANSAFLNFSFSSVGGGQHEFKSEWPVNRDGFRIPELHEWYHIAVVRSEKDELLMYVDGETLGDPVTINEMLVDGSGRLQIGAYYKRKRLFGQMDEIRIARGNSNWEVNYTDFYQFKNPKGIVIAPGVNNEGLKEDFLYVVDSGHNRIVRLSKDFHSWSTFGGPEPGSGRFQFNNPTDIYYNDNNGRFYITDTGNNRVVDTTITEMVHYLKGDSAGDWHASARYGTHGLSGIIVDNTGQVVVTDAYNAQIIQGSNIIGNKNPWDLLFAFTAPVDIQQDPASNNYYILDGVSPSDFSSSVGNRALDAYGSSQKEGLNVRFSSGGVIASEFNSQEIVARLNEKDWQQWVQDEVNLGVSHCPEIENESAHLIDPDGDIADDPDSWTGMGQEVHCEDPDKNSDWPSECVGQWDWESEWPNCTYYVPAYDKVEVCLETAICNDSTTSCPTNMTCRDYDSAIDSGTSCAGSYTSNEGCLYSDGVTLANADTLTSADGEYCCGGSSDVVKEDYECGCANSRWEGYSYCKAVADPPSCHVGYALSHSRKELGPPKWAPTPVKNAVPEGGRCSYMESGNGCNGWECSAYGQRAGSYECPLGGNNFIWDAEYSRSYSSRAVVVLPSSVPAALDCKVSINGEKADEFTPYSDSLYAGRKTYRGEYNGMYYNYDVVVDVECAEEVKGNYGRITSIDVSSRTWIIQNPVEDYTESFNVLNTECSATLYGTRYMPHYMFWQMVFYLEISRIASRIPPSIENIDILVSELEDADYKVTKMEDDPSPYIGYADKIFTDKCGSRQNVNDYFLYISTTTVDWRDESENIRERNYLVRVLGLASEHSFNDSWIIKLVDLASLDRDIAERDTVDNSDYECELESIYSCDGAEDLRDCFCSKTLRGVLCSESPGGAACAIETDIRASVGGLLGSPSGVDTLVSRLRALGHTAAVIEDIPFYDYITKNVGGYSNAYWFDCGYSNHTFYDILEINGMLFRVLGSEEIGSGPVYTYPWIANYITEDVLMGDI